MYTEEAEEQLLGGNPDFVLDAIDNIDTKVYPTELASRAQCFLQRMNGDIVLCIMLTFSLLSVSSIGIYKKSSMAPTRSFKTYIIQMCSSLLFLKTMPRVSAHPCIV